MPGGLCVIRTMNFVTHQNISRVFSAHNDEREVCKVLLLVIMASHGVLDASGQLLVSSSGAQPLPGLG